MKEILADWNLDDYTVKSIEAATDDLVSRATGYYDAAGAVSKDEVTFDNVIKVGFSLKKGSLK